MSDFKVPDEMSKEELDAYVEELENTQLRIVPLEETNEEGHNYTIQIKAPGSEEWQQMYVFGLIPQGGVDKAEALFWAERAVSNNGFAFTRPEGWEDIEPELPEREDG